MFRDDAKDSQAPRLKMFPSGKSEGVPSLESPNGSKLSSPVPPPVD